MERIFLVVNNCLNPCLKPQIHTNTLSQEVDEEKMFVLCCFFSVATKQKHYNMQGTVKHTFIYLSF